MTTQFKSVSHQQNPTEMAQSWLLAFIQGWGLLTLSLHIAAFALPEESSWSVWPYTFFPTWLRWVLALLVGALIIPAISHKTQKGLLWLYETILRFMNYLLAFISPPTRRRQVSFALVALLAGLLFWLARIRHLRWGDSYMLSVALSYHDLNLRVVYNWQAPFTVFLHQRLWHFVANPLLGWPVETVYSSISIICGLAFVYILLTFMYHLGRDQLETTFLSALILSTGSIQLFFGYVENYTIVSVVLLLMLFLAWRTLQGQIRPIWPVVSLSIANAFHPSTVFLWPGMCLLSWLAWKRKQVSTRGALLQTILPPLLLGGCVLALMESGGHGLAAFLGVDRPGGGDGIWFVPLFETTTQWQHYTMFSAAHIIDWSNIHFLISPFGLPLIIVTLVIIRRFGLIIFDTQSEQDYAYFLGITATMYLLLTYLWNPDYGGRKDWDLFAPAAFIYTLLAGYLLVRSLSSREKLRDGGLFIIAVSLLHTAAWIFTNTHPLARE